ncbi:MAG TPA: NAD(P)H-quinone oxidoreductase [Kofleriaceae bacterium]|nr:NAD(P)H-quinone oxidoreductase [Kofleriaceae bacterium]
MTTVRAVVIAKPGGVDVLSVGEVDVRAPGPFEIAVKVKAAGLNRADLLQRMGLYPAPAGSPDNVPGLEYAGEVIALGENVTEVREGDRVMGIVGGGAMAEEVIVDARCAVPIPESLAFEQAAAIPEAFFTAFDALVLQAKMTLGDVVLIHAVGSGVGAAAVQLVRAASARAFGTSRTQEKLDRAHALGTEAGILATDGKFADALRAKSGQRGADIILDTVGAAYLSENLHALADGGRMVAVGLLGGATGELPMGMLLKKRARILGTVLRSRPREDKIALAQAFRRSALPLFATGQLAPVIDQVFSMTAVREAHQRLEQNATFGKLILTWP